MCTFPNTGLFSPSQNPIACLYLPKQIVSSWGFLEDFHPHFFGGRGRKCSWTFVSFRDAEPEHLKQNQWFREIMFQNQWTANQLEINTYM